MAASSRFIAKINEQQRLIWVIEAVEGEWNTVLPCSAGDSRDAAISPRILDAEQLPDWLQIASGRFPARPQREPENRVFVRCAGQSSGLELEAGAFGRIPQQLPIVAAVALLLEAGRFTELSSAVGAHQATK